MTIARRVEPFPLRCATCGKFMLRVDKPGDAATVACCGRTLRLEWLDEERER